VSVLKTIAGTWSNNNLAWSAKWVGRWVGVSASVSLGGVHKEPKPFPGHGQPSVLDLGHLVVEVRQVQGVGIIGPTTNESHREQRVEQALTKTAKKCD